MKTEQLALFLISPDSTVVEAMQRIDRNARGILFVTNEQQKLLVLSRMEISAAG